MIVGGTRRFVPDSINHDLYTSLVELLTQYVEGNLVLREFHAAFAPLAWDAESCGDARAEELAYDVMHRFAEYTQGQWNEPALRALLRAIAANQRTPASST
jgi:hypothetical protein